MSSRTTQSTINEFVHNVKLIYYCKFSNASFTHPLTHSLIHSLTRCLIYSIKHSKKLATVTALLLWQKCLVVKKPFTILNAHCSLTILELIFLYWGQCFSIQLQSKVTLRFFASHEASAPSKNASQHTRMFRYDSVITA